MHYGSGVNHPVLVCILPGFALFFFPLSNSVSGPVSNGLHVCSFSPSHAVFSPFSSLLPSDPYQDPYLPESKHLK